MRLLLLDDLMTSYTNARPGAGTRFPDPRGALGYSRLIGKGKHIRTVPNSSGPALGEANVDAWTSAAEIAGGTIFRRVNRMGKLWGMGITPKAIWHVVKASAKRARIDKLAPHDLRRSCARFCHLSGGELEQIQFLLGHASVRTTERYLGGKQKLRHAVNGNLGLEDS